MTPRGYLMLERFWLILIFLLATIVPPMHAAQSGSFASAQVGCACAASFAAHQCACEGCPCASQQPTEQPAEQDPAVPAPRSEQQRASEPNFDFAELVLEDMAGPDRVAPLTREPALKAGGTRIESLLCVWRI